MKRIELSAVKHEVKIGDVCPALPPNVTEDCYLCSEGEVIGFYLHRAPADVAGMADLANAEFLSDRVPKSEMRRSSGLFSQENEVRQYSTILGSCAPKPHMKRPYPTISSVHQVQSASTFVRAMLKLVGLCEGVIQKLAPEIYERQLGILKQVDEDWRFGKLFTSSISNANIASPYHIDTANLVGCVNVIVAKRWGADGGNTTVPDYGATFDSADGSMLVYPAWRNVHGVTPISPRRKGGYRNSLVFYPLKAFSRA